MTVTFDDDPEIVVGGDTPDPSAPPAVAVAFATPINNNTTTTSSQQATIPLSTGDGNIERSINQDGSLSVKVTTTVTQNDGYREIKTEYFHIPSSMANTVMLSIDAGIPPSSLYRTNMQQRTETLSNAAPIPARAEVINTGTSSDPWMTAPATTPTPNNNGNQQQPNSTLTQTATTGASDQFNASARAVGVVMFAIIGVAIVGALAASNSNDNSSPSSNSSPSHPSYPTPYYPSPYSPSSEEPCPAWVPTSRAPIYGCKSKEQEPCAPHVSPNMAPIIGCIARREPCEPWISSDMAPIYNCIPLTPTISPHPTITASPSSPPSISPRPTKSHDPTYAPWTMPPFGRYPSMYPPTSTDRNKAVISQSDKLDLLLDNTEHVEE